MGANLFLSKRTKDDRTLAVAHSRVIAKNNKAGEIEKKAIIQMQSKVEREEVT